MTPSDTFATDDTLLPGAAQPRASHDASLTAPAPVGPGERVDHYVVRERLGAGGMGVVYRATDSRLGRDVALKLLHTHEPGTESCGILCSLLLREAQTMARLAHPSLVGVFDVGRFHGCVYVAMELVAGRTLREWQIASQPSWRERLSVLLKAGRGLVVAHDAQVFHRDFKPDNVLVAADGRVKVSDFGLARGPADLDAAAGAACGCGTDAATLKALDENAVVGTLRYMAPEQMRGLPADARSDQFAFAVTAWECLYESMPFGGDSLAELLDAATREAVCAPRDCGVPAGVEPTLRRGLREKPDVRYPSLAAMIEKLEPFARAI